MTDKTLLDRLIARVAARALEPCTCGRTEVTIVPTSEKTAMPHFVCDECGRLYAFNGFLVLRCVRAEHLMELDSETPDLTPEEWTERRRQINGLMKEFENDLSSMPRDAEEGGDQ